MAISYTFKQPQLFAKALTLASGNKSAQYERLEFLGDRVLGLIISDMLLKYYKKEKEGDIAKRFTALVREETLASVARQIELPEQLITKEGELRHNDSILADVMEAVLGAIFLDGGFDAAYDFAKPLFMPLLIQDIKPPIDSKTQLQEWVQKKKKTLPVYTLISRDGPDHAPSFVIKVSVEGLGESLGHGCSKRHAEQEAAANFLKEFKK